jgi:acyl carrier protein
MVTEYLTQVNGIYDDKTIYKYIKLRLQEKLMANEISSEKVLEKFKALIVKSHLNDDRSLSEERLSEIAKEVDGRVFIDTPLSAVGLDSMKMTWIIVRFEEELDIDASGVSFFELYDVNDLATEIIQLVKQKG